VKDHPFEQFERSCVQGAPAPQQSFGGGGGGGGGRGGDYGGGGYSNY